MTRFLAPFLAVLPVFLLAPAQANAQCVIGAPDCVTGCGGFQLKGADETTGFYLVGGLGGHQRIGVDYAPEVRGGGAAFDGAFGFRFNRLISLEAGFYLATVADTAGAGETDNYALRFDAKLTPVVYPGGRPPLFRPYLLIGGSPWAGFASNNGGSYDGWSLDAGAGFELAFPGTPFFFDASARYELIRYTRYTDTYGNVSPTGSPLVGDDLAVIAGLGLRFPGFGHW